MTKQVFLHIGAHKTGTTTLQAELAANRHALKKSGLIYPDFNGADSHHQWARFWAREMPSISGTCSVRNDDNVGAFECVGKVSAVRKTGCERMTNYFLYFG